MDLTTRWRIGAAFHRRHPRTRVLWFAVLLVAGGVGLLAATPGATHVPDRPWSLSIVVLVAAFAAAEASALHVEIRKESHSLSLSGIPLIFGLLFTSPVNVVGAYVLGALPTILWVRKSEWLKAVWNSSLFFAEAALAGLIVRQGLGERLPSRTVEWLVPLAAMLAAEIMSLVAVPLVIMTVDAKFRPHLFADVGRAQVLAVLAGSFTVTTVAASLASPYMALFALVPIVGVGLLLRSTGHLVQRFKDLQQLHTFTRALTNERGPRTLDVGLLELVKIMRSQSAGLIVVRGERDDAGAMRILLDDTFEDGAAEPLATALAPVLRPGTVTHLTRDDPRAGVQQVLDVLHSNTLLAVNVLGEADRRSILFVTDRLGMRATYTPDEVRLFGSLANTLGARLTNDYLVERLEAQARVDSLTGLANRLSLEIALTACLSRDDQDGVVVMIDLDRFKEINDSLGHEMGDRLLIEIGRRLRRAVRTTDVVARFGGDEFAALLCGVGPDAGDDLAVRVGQLHELLTAKVELDGITFAVGASLGVVKWPAQGVDSERLLHRADVAMYEAKRNQSNVVWYTPELEADAPRRQDLYLSVTTAMENRDFYLNFQPKVSLEDGRVTGAEALVRWHHPVHGPVSPTEFIPLILQAGLIGKLTRFALERAADAAVLLRDAGIAVPIAVNLTTQDLLDPNLVADLAAILAHAGLDADAIQVEITEDAMVVDMETSISVLHGLQALGIRVAIDDFGTGYSSLQHLHRLPVDELKIDQSFVSRLTANEAAATAIVRASINLANDLKLTTVAEGVDDDRSLGVVASLGCREIQGFLVGRPFAVDDLMRWLRAWDAESFRRDRVGPTSVAAERRRAASGMPTDRRAGEIRTPDLLTPSQAR